MLVHRVSPHRKILFLRIRIVQKSMKERTTMDKKLYNTWMTITALVLGIIGLAFIMVSIFDSGAGSSVLIIGLLFVVVGNLFNVIRMQQNRKNQEG